MPRIDKEYVDIVIREIANIVLNTFLNGKGRVWGAVIVILASWEKHFIRVCKKFIFSRNNLSFFKIPVVFEK